MIHEFAVEPDLVAQWGNLSDYRYFATCFGLGRARMVSEFPKLKNWRRDILRAIEGADDLEKTRVIELVGIMSERMVRRDGYAYDSARPWLENSEAEHARCPFHLVLASTNPRNNGRVLSKAVIGEPNDTRWNLKQTLPVPRTAIELAKALQPMLSNCSEAYLIDPYFRPQDNDYRVTLESFLEAMLVNRGGPLPKLVEVISGQNSSEEFFADECAARLPRHIPVGMSVRFKRIKARGGGRELHNRYILTDLGGVFLGRGLDKGETEHSEDMALLDKGHFLQRWEEYVGPEPAFDMAGLSDQPEQPVEVIGIK